MPATNLEQVAEFLLNEGLHVTALELNSELLRNQGRELSAIRRYFTSNPRPSTVNSSTTSSGQIRNQQQHRTSTPIVKRSPSVQTFDSLDLARGSDDGAIDQTTERIAVLEFELRKANETIASLRTSLTEATSATSASSHGGSSSNSVARQGTQIINTIVDDEDEAIKPHERKAISFLIHNFLISQSYKMTAITLSEEVRDQNFDSWFDVGLDTPKPPTLLQLFRLYLWVKTNDHHWQCNTSSSSSSCTKNISDKAHDERQDGTTGSKESSGKIDQQIQTDLLQCPVNEDRWTNTSQPSSLLVIHTEDKSCQTDRLLSFLRRSDDQQVPKDNLDMYNSSGGTSTTTNSTSGTAGDGGNVDEATCTELTSSKLLLPCAFRSTLISEANLMVESEITFELMATERQLIQLLAHDLPIIASHIPCNENRADLLPLIVSTTAIITCQSNSLNGNNNNSNSNSNNNSNSYNCSINNHTRETCDKLLYTFFDLIPSPNVLHRKLIVSALVTLANVYPQKRLQEEILPIIWEQLTHRSPERRILVIDSCIQLLPLVCPSIRVSLILSILSQALSEEKDIQVKDAAIKAFAYLIVVLAEDESSCDKWDFILKQTLLPSLLENNLQGSICNDVSMRRSLIRFFMPAFCYWSLRVKKLTQLTTELVSFGMNQKSQLAIVCLEICVPFIFLNLVTTAPKLTTNVTSVDEDKGHRFCFINNKLLNLQIITGSSVGSIIGNFDQLLARDWFKPWQEWDEFDRKILPLILSTLIPNCLNSQLTALINLCSSLGQHLGLSVLRLKVKPILLRAIYQEMNETSGSPIEGGSSRANVAEANESVQMLLPCFGAVLISVKPIQDEEKRDLATCLGKCLLLGHTKAVLDTVELIVGESHSDGTRNDLNNVIIGFLSESLGHSDMVNLAIMRILDSFICANAKVSLSYETTASLVKDCLKLIDRVNELISFCSSSSSTSASGTSTSGSSGLSSAGGNNNSSATGIKNYCISCYGSLLILILSNSGCESLLQPLNSKLDLLLEGENIESHIELVTLLARVARSCSEHLMNVKSHLFLDYSLPRLAAITVQCRSNTGNKRKQELILALLDCYTKFSFLTASDQLVRESVLPSLRLTKCEVSSIAPEYEETVITLIQEFERKLTEASNASVTSSATSTSTSAININNKDIVVSPTTTATAMAIASSHPLVPSVTTTFSSSPCSSSSSSSSSTCTSTVTTMTTTTCSGTSNKHPSDADLRTRFKGFFHKKPN